MSSEFALIHIVMLLALVEYFVFLLLVGSARYRFGVKAPAISGNADFERYYRVQMNTLEILVIFLPALWSFALFVSIRWAALLGLVFILGRALYFFGYTRAAEKRSLGFALSSLPMLVLLVGGLLGAGEAWLG
jgi:glutathione S-transferase